MDVKYVRRAILGLLAGGLALPIVGAEARGARCQLARKPRHPLTRCNANLKLCGRVCIPASSACCGSTGYKPFCENGRSYVCRNGVGQCCNGGGNQCDPAPRACP